MGKIGNSNKIARNTILLYFRMILMMLVSLYSVRILLNTLGVVDYGIYQLVGGVVTLLSFLSNTMASASQRFFSYEIGKSIKGRLNKTFNMVVLIYIIMAIVIFVLAETVGLWFLNNKVNIPHDRMDSAFWVYQFSVLTFMTSILIVPFNSIVISFERMSIFAYVSIIEAILKLLIIFLLKIIFYDKLITYSFLLFAVSCTVSTVYFFYCQRNFSECKIHFKWDLKMFKELVGYSSWNLFGSIAVVLKSQGVNVMLNMFFNTIVNTAWGISTQISSVLNQFVLNFTKAVNPQIIKYYSVGDYGNMTNLIFKSSKLSYFLFMILSMPILLNTDFILSFWLGEVPQYTIIFTRLIVVNVLIDSLSSSLITAALSTGNIRKYQVLVGGTIMLILPFSYFLLKLNLPAYSPMLVSIVISIGMLFLRVILLKKMISFPVKKFVFSVIGLCCLITVLSYIFPIVLLYLFNNIDIYKFIFISVCGFCISVFVIYSYGLSFQEREFVLNNLKKIYKKIYVKGSGL